MRCCFELTEYSELAQMLIERGADINAAGEQGKQKIEIFEEKTNEQKQAVFTGFTPLLRSVNMGNEKIFRILVEKGANVKAKMNDGDSALNLAVLNGKTAL